MRTNYVLIDYENVQAMALAVLNQEHFKVLVFVGANQTKMSFEAAEAIQLLGSRASYIRISGNGPNALDFHIAFYIGQLAAADPDGFFHVISKDTGFDPLIVHLKTKKILACRSKDVTDIPIIKSGSSKTSAEKHEAVVARLRQLGQSKPRTVKTLSSTINSLFQNGLSELELSAVLNWLSDKGIVSVSGTKVAYALPTR